MGASVEKFLVRDTVNKCKALMDISNLNPLIISSEMKINAKK